MLSEKHIDAVRFDDIYYRLRQKEGRIYTDEEVLKLPEINLSHQYYNEWQIRKGSCDRLMKYLLTKDKPSEILEVGCGNGWLSAKLASVANNVIGIDVNSYELEQAKRVFNKISNLEFRTDTIGEIIGDKKFDVMVFAASIQYFPVLKETLHVAKQHLKDDGEIHLIDSHFYEAREVNDARRRSEAYFDSIGFGTMISHYHHHCIDDLKELDYKILYRPGAIASFFGKNKSPFPWICIYNK